MNEKNFSEKAKQLSRFSTMGVDVTGLSGMEEIYEREPDFTYEDTIEGKLLEELKNGIEGYESSRFFDALASMVGTARAEGIREALLARLGSFERDSRERYDARERKAHDFDSQIDDLDVDRSHDKEDKYMLLSEIRTRGNSSNEETSIFMRNVEENLYDVIEKLEKSLQTHDLSAIVSDIVHQYRQKAMDINDGLYSEIKKVEQEIEGIIKENDERNDDERKIAEQIGINGDEVLSKYEKFGYVTQTLRQGIGASVIREFDQEKGEKGIWISNRILDKAISEKNPNLFDENDLSILETPEIIYFFTKAEHEKMLEKEKEKEQEKQKSRDVDENGVPIYFRIKNKS